MPAKENPAMSNLIEYEESTGVVRQVYDDIRATRKTDYINNFWKALANHPPTLEQTWTMLKEIMTGPGEIDPLMRELIYIAVSVTNGCDYCVASHKAAATGKGLTEPMYGEFLRIVGAANMTNRFVQGYRIPLDDRFKS
jgi:AhpD family alkylhydroperoxidase